MLHEFAKCPFFGARQFCSTQLWYTGGWNQEKKLLRKATVAPNLDADAKHFGEGRVSGSCCSNITQSVICTL